MLATFCFEQKTSNTAINSLDIKFKIKAKMSTNYKMNFYYLLPTKMLIKIDIYNFGPS